MWVTPNKNCNTFAIAAFLHVILQFQNILAWIKRGIRKNKYWNRLEILEFVLLEYSYWPELCISTRLANTYRFSSFLFFSFFFYLCSFCLGVLLNYIFSKLQICTVKNQEKIEQVNSREKKNPFLSLQLARTPKQQDQAVLLCVGGITW